MYKLAFPSLLNSMPDEVEWNPFAGQSEMQVLESSERTTFAELNEGDIVNIQYGAYIISGGLKIDGTGKNFEYNNLVKPMDGNLVATHNSTKILCFSHKILELDNNGNYNPKKRESCTKNAARFESQRNEQRQYLYA